MIIVGHTLTLFLVLLYSLFFLSNFADKQSLSKTTGQIGAVRGHSKFLLNCSINRKRLQTRCFQRHREHILRRKMLLFMSWVARASSLLYTQLSVSRAFQLAWKDCFRDWLPDSSTWNTAKRCCFLAFTVSWLSEEFSPSSLGGRKIFTLSAVTSVIKNTHFLLFNWVLYTKYAVCIWALMTVKNSSFWHLYRIIVIVENE